MKIRQHIRDWLFKDVPTTIANPNYQLPKKQEPSQGTVVEAPIEAERWQPEQHGNVIIAEPDIMKEFRQNNGKM